MKKFLIIANPGKRLYNVVEKVRSSIQRGGHSFIVGHDLDDPSLANFSDIILIGDDGTLNYAINQLPSFDLPIGIVPAGNGNDYIKSMNNPAAELTEYRAYRYCSSSNWPK